MIIDVHPHIISDDTVKYPITPLGNKRSKWSEARGSMTAEKLIESMKAAGVDKAVVVHSRQRPTAITAIIWPIPWRSIPISCRA